MTINKKIKLIVSLIAVLTVAGYVCISFAYQGLMQDTKEQLPAVADGLEGTSMNVVAHTEEIGDTPKDRFVQMFTAQYDPNDAGIAELAALPEYRTDIYIYSKQFGYGREYPDEENIYNDAYLECKRNKIFKAYYVNTNYVLFYLDRNELYSIIETEPRYLVPVNLRASSSKASGGGALFYRKDSAGNWNYHDYTQYIASGGDNPYFDSDTVWQRLSDLGFSEVVDLKFVLFGDRALFLFAKDISGKEEFLVLCVNGAVGRFNIGDGAYLEPFYKFTKEGKEWRGGGNFEGGSTQKQKTDYTTEAEELSSLGLVHGTGNGFELTKLSDRMQGITMLVRGIGQEQEALSGEYDNVFDDVPDNHWGMKYANFAYDNGITKGTGEGEFSPEKRLTQREFVMLLLRAMGYDISGKDEYEIWKLARDIGLFGENAQRDFTDVEEGDPSGNGYSKNLFTRGDMIKIIYNALDCNTADGRLFRDEVGI